MGAGDVDEKNLDKNGKSLDSRDYSMFADIYIPSTPFSVMSRYNHFEIKTQEINTTESLLTGFVYHFDKQSKVMLVYDRGIKKIGEKSTKSTCEVMVEVYF